ncbi:MAG: DUF92 domain-containing protein [Balneolaceae bacterium]|nr:DUF92 domain-containing protein [Balneolaceae bacterium]
MYRLINYFFGFIVIYLFILEAGMNDHAMIIIGLTLSVFVAFITFFGNWITLDATKAVIILGTIVLGFGGWMLALAVILFFATGSLLTRKKRVLGITDRFKRNIPLHLQKRRDGYQVWANGFWLAVFCLGWFLLSADAFLIAAFVTLATATADTWATEVGTVKPGKTVSIITFNQVDAGTDGGVSMKGTAAAISGALIISMVVYFLNFPNSNAVFFLVFVLGIVGCFIDSIIGAILNRKGLTINKPADYSGSQESFTNSFVNWASTGISGLLALFLTQIVL